MPTRAVWRPPWYGWILVWLAALASIYLLAPARLHGHWRFVTPALAVVAVLALRRLWERPPAATMCAAIVLTIFSGAWWQLGLKGFPVDRLLLVIVLAQLLLRAPGVAALPRLQLRDVHLLMGVTVLYVFASAIAAGTLTTGTNLLLLVDQIGLAPYLVFLLAPAVFAGRRERNMLLATLVGLGAYLGFTAIFESLGPHSLVFPRYILHVDNELPGERAGGPFQSSVAEGFATFACAVAAAVAFVQWRGLRRRRLAGLVVAACAFGCFLTLERGVWLAAVVATVVTALATRTGRRWLAPGLLVGVLAVGTALVVSANLTHKTANRATQELSLWDRQTQTAAGLRMFEAKPLFGFGWGRYTTDSLAYFREPSDYPMTGYVLGERIGTANPPLPLHDTYLAFAVELGLVGVLLWLASLVWGAGGAIRSRRPAPDLRLWKLGLTAVIVFYLVVAVVDPHEQAFPVVLLWCWAGVASGGVSLAEQASRAGARARRRPAFGVRPALALEGRQLAPGG